VDNLRNVRLGVSKHFRNKKKTHLRAKIEELETYSKTKTCIGASVISRSVTSPELI
jgi:hypothetical protein